MLVAERSNSEIIELLTSDSLLEKKVEKAVTSLYVPDTEVRETLGVMLFQEVSEIEQELCAQVTGMLLELPVSSLTQLLKNQEALKEAVMKAKREYLKFITEEEIQKSEEVPPGTKSISKEKQELGEIIYEKLLTSYPTEASKLTGMLLQMEYRDLLRVIAEPKHLSEKVELALRVLQGEGSRKN
ncbi:polyadenylate-binding protein, cytoplasmic and nuclear-like isoform X2 [Penaeus chinensis]|nr:polyadenylate-binding protein, cytoplasmic and nuclear-like isoform X2 [Penaeus chinensis]